VELINDNTAAVASIEDVAGCTARADAQVRKVLSGVMAQRRTAAVAFDYVAALAPGVKANCWSLAESAGHEGWGRMQALLGSYRWDWRQLRARLAGLAAAWIPRADGDLIGPGIAIDETAQLKHGDATACVAPQHAGCTGQVENCVTTVFSAYVTAKGQATKPSSPAQHRIKDSLLHQALLAFRTHFGTRRLSAGPFSAASSTNTSGPRRNPGQHRWPSSGTPQGAGVTLAARSAGRGSPEGSTTGLLQTPECMGAAVSRPVEPADAPSHVFRITSSSFPRTPRSLPLVTDGSVAE